MPNAHVFSMRPQHLTAMVAAGAGVQVLHLSVYSNLHDRGGFTKPQEPGEPDQECALSPTSTSPMPCYCWPVVVSKLCDSAHHIEAWCSLEL